MITAGEVIKEKRKALGKSLDTISSDTKIQKRYLEYIENNEFDKFDSPVFASGFIKIYAQYLGLDVDKVLALYRRSLNIPSKTKKTKKPKREKKKIKISPKTIGLGLLILFIISIAGYIGYQIYKFQKPPELTILQPQDEFSSQEENILIKGKTQSGAIIEINGKQIKVNNNGEFEYEYKLTQGVNTISIKAWKETNTQLQNKITLRVTYTPKDEEIATPTETKEFILTLSITNSPAWIKLDVDGENKISGVLQENTQHEYKVEKTFTLVTGKANNTSLKVNGEEIKILTSAQTGIGQITCNIQENKLLCE